jgi:hypothetical protein
MKKLTKTILVATLAFMAAVGNDVYAEVEKSSDITWYSPVGVSFMDNAYPWVGRYGGHGDKLDNPGVIGLGVNFLLGECGEMNGLLLNLGILGFCGHLGKVSSMTGTMRGVTAGMLVNANGRTQGMMVGPINFAEDIDGCMVGCCNTCDYSKIVRGLQIGVINHVSGYGTSGFIVQVGFYNYSDMPALQIGLINRIPDGRFPVLPVINLYW